MKKENKLSLMVIAMMAVAIVGVAVLLLWQASAISVNSKDVYKMTQLTIILATLAIASAVAIMFFVLSKTTEAGRGGLREVAAAIQEIARESEGLLKMNMVMKGIASQTNLLSINAAIKAAHAGEAGKGLAVFAEEIRELAESSSEQSEIISDVLKKIIGSIGNIAKSTEGVLNKFETIDSSVRTVARQEDNIRSAMEEQGQGSKQVLDSVVNVNDTSIWDRESIKTLMREISHFEVD
jgi:methyl-accepting chemotaxis protein